jgi:hypothetical protein
MCWLGGTAALAFRSQNTSLLMWTAALVLNGTIERLLELQQGVVPIVLLSCVFALRSSPAPVGGRA